MSITSTPILALLIAAGLLLVPDLTMLEIPGVLRLERQVQEQARRQEDVINLIQQISVSQRQETIIQLAEVIPRLQEKVESFESDDT